MKTGLAVVVLCVFSPLSAKAFECTRSSQYEFVSIYWAGSEPIQYAVQENTSRRMSLELLESALKAGFSQWSSPTCSSLQFDYRGEAEVRTELKEMNQIIVVSEEWPEASVDAVGLTTMFYNPKNGVISHGKIELNEVNFDFVDVLESGCGLATEYDLHAVLTHEIGHFIGLAHVSEAYRQARVDLGEDPPTMSPEVFECDEQFRTLEADDLEAVCFVYPAGQIARSCATLPSQKSSFISNDPFGCSAGLGNAQGGEYKGLGLLVLLLLLGTMMRVRVYRPRGSPGRLLSGLVPGINQSKARVRQSGHTRNRADRDH
jgi:hypothetical protein